MACQVGWVDSAMQIQREMLFPGDCDCFFFLTYMTFMPHSMNCAGYSTRLQVWLQCPGSYMGTVLGS